jgi:hypothetical protein
MDKRGLQETFMDKAEALLMVMPLQIYAGGKGTADKWLCFFILY